MIIFQGSLNPSFIKTMRQKYFYKMALKQSEPKEEAVREAAEDYKKSLNFVKSYFLKGADFLCGDQISIADLLLASSLEQVSASSTRYERVCGVTFIDMAYS